MIKGKPGEAAGCPIAIAGFGSYRNWKYKLKRDVGEFR